MTNQYHDVRINLTLAHVDGTKDVTMRRGMLLPFVPREGDTIRLYDEGTFERDPETRDIIASSVVYDTQDKCFDIYVEDTSLQEGYRAGERPTMDDLIAEYTPYGFVRHGYPTVQIK